MIQCSNNEIQHLLIVLNIIMCLYVCKYAALYLDGIVSGQMLHNYYMNTRILLWNQSIFEPFSNYYSKDPVRSIPFYKFCSLFFKYNQYSCRNFWYFTMIFACIPIDKRNKAQNISILLIAHNFPYRNVSGVHCQWHRIAWLKLYQHGMKFMKRGC